MKRVMASELRAGEPEPPRASVDRELALTDLRTRLQAILGVLDAALAGREFIVAGGFTAADVVLASILHLAHTLELLDEHPRLLDYVRTHSGRPAARRAVSP